MGSKMNDEKLDRLYNLLPSIYRIRDHERGEPLRALLQVIAEQVNVIEDDMAQLYENWFIETCENWVVPYIGDLVGYRPVHEAGEPGDPKTAAGAARNKILIPRREVGNTIYYRRRKGTLPLLEIMANEVAGWPARAVEFFKLLGWTQNLNHLHLDQARYADMRDGEALELLGSPFDRMAYTVDIRRINASHTTGRHNIPSVGLFVYRLGSFPVTRTQAYCLEKPGPHCYSFSALGNDVPLFSATEPEPELSHIAGELNLPMPVRRRPLEIDLRRAVEEPDYASKYYGEGKSFAIWAGEWAGHEKHHEPREPVPAKAIIVANLSGWRYAPPEGRIAVDPVLGRIAFPVDQLPGRDSRRGGQRMRGVRVSYHFGFSAGMGGGEYDRTVQQPPRAEIVQVKSGKELTDALLRWRTDSPHFDDQPEDAVIEIMESGVYVLPFHITLKPGHSLQIRAARRKRPVLRLLDYQTDLPDTLYVGMAQESRFTLDGLLVTGRPVRFQATDQATGGNGSKEAGYTASQPTNTDPQKKENKEVGARSGVCAGQLVIRHCTLVPGWELEHDGEPRRPAEPSLELVNVRLRVRIEHSIVGSIQVSEDQVRTEPIPICITDSVIDATNNEGEALGGVGRPVAHAVLMIQRCTVFGEVLVHAIDLAENCIFTNCLSVARRQLGCMRFCYVPERCRTPRRYHCQPDHAQQAIAEKLRMKNPLVTQKEIDAAREQERNRVLPQFNSTRYGRPDYAQLADGCAEEIKRGADDESEMGAFHDLYNPQREANLRARLDEYTPAGVEPGIITVT